VSGDYAHDRPLHEIALGDRQGTELYVSARSGKIVQRTTARERVWNYAGAVTHWLYFTPLRVHSTAWARTVIGLSGLGLCLTAAGLYLGIAQLGLGQRSLLRSPFSGVRLWHHVLGTLVGVFAIAWVGSGLLSMNPWGLLESQYGADEQAHLRQLDLTSTVAIDTAERLVRDTAAGGLTNGRGLLQLANTPLGPALTLLATGTKGRSRLNASTLGPTPLQPAELLEALRHLRPGQAPASAGLLSAGDDYYYSEHDTPLAAAYRVVFDDAEHSRYYFDPVSGALLLKIDRAARGYRWWFNAIHRWDFSPGMRHRPLWDFVVGALLLGVTASSITGVVLGFRRLTRRSPNA
jgi:uncharacterized iron-regulated membrane protein